MNNKKEGEYYYQMVRKYKDEYGGKNLKDSISGASCTGIPQTVMSISFFPKSTIVFAYITIIIRVSMKSDEKSIRALAAQAHNAEADKRTLQKYFHDILNRVMVTVEKDLASILPNITPAY